MSDTEFQNLKNKNVLITGASGFLGGYVADLCYRNGAYVCGVDIKQSEKPKVWYDFHVKSVQSAELVELFSNRYFDYVFHLAGSASVPFSIQAPVEDFNSLLPPTVHLLYLIKKYCPHAHLVCFSSAAVYGNPSVLPIREDAPKKPLSPYGIHKAVSEDLLQYYSVYYKLKISILRIFSAYGIGLRKQLFWDVMQKYLSNPKEIRLFGTGKETRDFIHANDVARAALYVALNPLVQDCTIYNVGSGQQTTVSEVIELLFSATAEKPKIVFNHEEHTGNPKYWQAATDELTKTGFLVKESISETLINYYNWVLNLSKV